MLYVGFGCVLWERHNEEVKPKSMKQKKHYSHILEKVLVPTGGGGKVWGQQGAQ
jgi:hypothetical protein